MQVILIIQFWKDSDKINIERNVEVPNKLQYSVTTKYHDVILGNKERGGRLSEYYESVSEGVNVWERGE